MSNALQTLKVPRESSKAGNSQNTPGAPTAEGASTAPKVEEASGVPPPTGAAPASPPTDPGPSAVVIRTQAGDTLTHANISFWLSGDLINPLADACVIDIYIAQVCYYVNLTRRLLPSTSSPALSPSFANPAPTPTPTVRHLRAMLSQPHAFYLAIVVPGGEAAGCAMLRAAGISRAEFRQLEYFFVPIVYNEHSSLVVISPLDCTVELADAGMRSPQAMCNIFLVVIRFLIHELGHLGGRLEASRVPWRFLWGRNPRQISRADCGNYTCLFAKVLALQQPLDSHTDVGQGVDYADEECLKQFVVNDLKIPVWTEEVFPLGNLDPTMRHWGQDSLSWVQHKLFFDVETAPYMTLRSRTGIHDHKTVAELTAWCEAQPLLPFGGAIMVPRMRGHEWWALLGREQFVVRIEQREADVLNNVFPDESPEADD